MVSIAMVMSAILPLAACGASAAERAAQKEGVSTGELLGRLDVSDQRARMWCRLGGNDYAATNDGGDMDVADAYFDACMDAWRKG